jgi:hypothetical protein
MFRGIIMVLLNMFPIKNLFFGVSGPYYVPFSGPDPDVFSSEAPDEDALEILGHIRGLRDDQQGRQLDHEGLRDSLR